MTTSIPTPTPRTIQVEPGSELDRLLDIVDDGTPVVLVRDGKQYRVRVLPNADQVARTIAGMRAAAGSWGDVDAASLKEYVYLGRDEGTRADMPE